MDINYLTKKITFAMFMDKGKVIVSADKVELILLRLCHQLIENHSDVKSLCIIGIQERGVLLADRIKYHLDSILETPTYQYGKLDITFYRDDFRRREVPIKASSTELDFSVEDKNVVLVDDVLYTGRTVHAAMAAIQDYGRPRRIEMLCMVDRRFNRHFPIRADYAGVSIDSLDEAYVKVGWQELDGKNEVRLFSGKKQ
jgi:pyrimidine operon attenuation protein / uracil phosphoribosyltransferase